MNSNCHVTLACEASTCRLLSGPMSRVSPPDSATSAVQSHSDSLARRHTGDAPRTRLAPPSDTPSHVASLHWTEG